MISLSLQTLASHIQHRKVVGDAEFVGVSVSSQAVSPGNLFVAWKGEERDAHDFVRDAEKAGAAALLVEREVEISLSYLVVDDAQKALGEMAHFWRQQFDVPVIAVTGSNGKTTIKNLLGAIFDEHYHHDTAAYLVNESSFNNHVGVPLTLLKLNDKHRVVITEMGMNHFGEIAYLTKIAEPNCALINNALHSHLAGVGGTLEGVARAKGEIFLGLKEDGIAVLNHDSPFFSYWGSLVATKKVLTFGLTSKANIYAEEVQLLPAESRYTLKTPTGHTTITLPLLGKHNVANSIAAAAVAIAMGVDLETIQAAYAHFQTTGRRLEQHHLASGAVLIDDGYNANPDSTCAAIDVLKMMSGDKILIFGDMKELGPDEKQQHEQVGRYAKEAGIDALYTIGDLTKETVKTFGKGALHFDSRDALLAALKPHLKAGNVILVKGSFSMNMRWFVDQLLGSINEA